MTTRTIVSTLLFALALTPLGAQPDPSKEELKLKLPKPMFIGTPTNIRSANLEAVTGKPRGPFYVPKGTVLLSLKKTVTSSDAAAGHRRARHDHRRREGGRGRVLRRARTGAAVGADRPRRLAPAPRHPRVALPQPGARLSRRRRPGLRRPDVQDRRHDGLQQRPRQHVEARSRARTRSTSRSPRASCSTRRARRAATSGSTPTGTRRTT